MRRCRCCCRPASTCPACMRARRGPAAPAFSASLADRPTGNGRRCRMKPEVRKGQWTGLHTREEFRERFRARFFDPAFRGEDEAIDRLEAIAWEGYTKGRKAPVTRKAGREFKDPDYDLSIEWYEARNRLLAAQDRWQDPGTTSRGLGVCAGPSTDGTRP